MDLFNEIVVTYLVNPPKVAYMEKGQVYQTVNRECFGLVLCLEGEAAYTMNGKTYVSNKNTALILPKGGSYSRLGVTEGLFAIVNFQAKELPDTDILTFPLQNYQECLEDFEKLRKLCLRQNGHLKAYSVFYRLLEKVFAASMSKATPLDPILQYIEENLSNPDISNATLAKQMEISEIYFRKLFAAHYGVTPRQYILDLRMQKAKHLLTDTLLSVTEISETCGFSSIYHFCQTFKKRTGLTPKQYAQKNRSFKI